MIRSLSREQEKLMAAEDVEGLKRLKQRLDRAEADRREEHRRVIQYQQVIREICEAYELDYKEVRRQFLR